MNSKKTKTLVFTALFAALCCVGTMISFPTPTGGYIHPGDSMVLLAGIILGPIYGGLAAGIVGNLIQNGFGIVLSVVLYSALKNVLGSQLEIKGLQNMNV